MPVNISFLRSLENVSSLDQLKLNAENQLETRSALNRIGHAIADAFRNLSSAGRTTIASRNDAIASAVRAAVNEARNDAAPEVKSLGDRLKNTSVSLQNAAAMSKQVVFTDILNSVKGDKRYKAMAPHAQKMLEDALTKMANNTALPEWPAKMNGLRDTFFGIPPAGFDLAKGVRDLGEAHKTQFLLNSQQKHVMPDGIHSAFLTDASRGCMVCIGGDPTPANMGHHNYAMLLKDLLGQEYAHFLPFVSMMCSQAGMDGSILFLPMFSGLETTGFQGFMPYGIANLEYQSTHDNAITRDGNVLTIHSTFSMPLAPKDNLTLDAAGLFCKGSLTMKIDLSAPHYSETQKDVHVQGFKREYDPVETHVVPERTVYIPQFTLENASVHFEAAQA